MSSTHRLLFAALMCPAPALAQVVYDNGPPDLVNAYHSDFDLSSPSDTVQLGDDFILGAQATFDHALFFGAYGGDNLPPASDSFMVRVFDFSSGTPPNLPLHEFQVGAGDSRVDTGWDVFGFDVYEHRATFPAVTLPAGKYFLSIVNDTTGTTSEWFWATAANTPDAWERDTDAATWIQHVVASAFTLSNENPDGPIGTNYCGPANFNSTGQSAIISGFGTLEASKNRVELTASQLPLNVFGYFLNSDTQGFKSFPPGSNGNLCLGGGIGRHVKQIANSGAAGDLVIDVDLTTLPRPGGTHSVLAGETWNFQCWFRDNQGGPTSNFTDGIEIVFK